MATGFFLLFFFLLISSPRSSAQSAIKFLPGFPGLLPFQLETGYIGVRESEDVQLFYYFLKSENDPKEDPLIIWLSGGPGCSTISPFLYEVGPLYFDVNDFKGSLPTLKLNLNAWTKVSSILFVDSPVGAGFSYATNPGSSHSSDSLVAIQISEFFRKWLKIHPEFISNPAYVSGNSYTGFVVPPVCLQILEDNEAGMKPTINLKGYLLGCPVTDSFFDYNSLIPYAHGMALISDELYESLRINCKENYLHIDPKNTLCLEDFEAFKECIDGLNYYHILEPPCPYQSPKPFALFHDRISLNTIAFPNPSEKHCWSYGYVLSEYWLNNNLVREALHVRDETVGKWVRCNNDINYTNDILSTIQYHANLSSKGYRSIIYGGDHDMIVPFLGTEKWIKFLNYSIVSEWRSWKAYGEISGYTRTYSNQMTFATVKGAGHTPAEFKARECFEMFKRWISGKPL